ncbi:MAG: hypothetical protein EOO72_06800 [Myxococcaceae bacterium]|nr:MAG: hypothetical protein EOO72_06800 [Myxococcaceae bacterium]
MLALPDRGNLPLVTRRRNEVGELQERLAIGDWRAMLEPGAEGLLTLALVADPAWWAGAIDQIREAIGGDLHDADSREVKLVLRDWCEAPRGSPEEADVLLRWCEAIVEASFMTTEAHRQAVAAIRRCVP